jgi:hypothetical protein
LGCRKGNWRKLVEKRGRKRTRKKRGRKRRTRKKGVGLTKTEGKVKRGVDQN